jgi:Arc/MetJ-type ribon-helix-helix transcriptional regulator
METISLKMENSLLKEIDSKLKKHRYSTRTEFIRDAIRTKLSDLEKEEIIKKLEAFKGSLKPKSNMTDEEAGEIAFREIAKKLNVKLN